MARDHAGLGYAHHMGVLTRSDVELQRPYGDVFGQRHPDARINLTHGIVNHHVGTHVTRLRLLVRHARGIGCRRYERLVHERLLRAVIIGTRMIRQVAAVPATHEARAAFAAVHTGRLSGQPP